MSTFFIIFLAGVLQYIQDGDMAFQNRLASALFLLLRGLRFLYAASYEIELSARQVLDSFVSMCFYLERFSIDY